MTISGKCLLHRKWVLCSLVHQHFCFSPYGLQLEKKAVRRRKKNKKTKTTVLRTIPKSGWSIGHFFKNLLLFLFTFFAKITKKNCDFFLACFARNFSCKFVSQKWPILQFLGVKKKLANGEKAVSRLQFLGVKKKWANGEKAVGRARKTGFSIFLA